MSERTDELRKSLLRSPKNGYDRISAEDRAEMERYCKDYMKFMDAAKTERAHGSSINNQQPKN